jgi:predicted DNA-binding transcriptional regulator AlpA
MSPTTKNDLDLDLNKPGFIGVREMQALLDMSARTIFRMIGEKRIPAPIRALSSRRLRWRRSTIRDWFDKLEAGAATRGGQARGARRA